MKEIFNSSTRFNLTLMIVALIGINIYTMIYMPDTIFKDVFQLFSAVTNGLLGYFIAKSTQDGKQNTMSSTISQDLPEEKKEPESVIIDRG